MTIQLTDKFINHSLFQNIDSDSVIQLSTAT